MIRTALAAAPSTGPHRFDASSYRVSPGARHRDGSSTVARVVLEETPTSVSIGAVIRFGDDASEGAFSSLATPLRDRTVLDGETGRTLSKRTAAPQ